MPKNNPQPFAVTLAPDEARRPALTDEEHQLIERAIHCLEARYHVSKEALSSPSETLDYLKLRLDGLAYEVFAVLLLVNRHRVLNYVELFRGTVDGASVHPREVVRLVLRTNAAAVIFTHNHPSGVAEPSQADMQITHRLKDALALVDVRVLDHLIIGEGRGTSFAERGLM